MRNQRRLLVGATVSAFLILLSGCGAKGADESGTKADKTTTSTATTAVAKTTTSAAEEGRGDPIPDEPEVSTGPTTDLATVTDPVNSAFSVDVPVGWDNLVYSTVDGPVWHEVVNTVSPDGGTVLFIGDPKIPTYYNPAMADDITRNFAEWLDTMELASYDPATSYFENYVTDKFGGLEGFEIVSVEEDQARQEKFRTETANAGMALENLDVADVRFTFVDGEGKTNSAVVVGATYNFGVAWNADVVGAASDGDVEEFLPMLESMSKSKQTLPEFTALQNQRHADTMAMIQRRTEEMTRQHEANMAWIQDSANAHQQRMESIWAAGDASVAGFYDRMASGDIEQRQFLNYINEENTVQSSEGKKFQVDSSYDRYWVNPATGEYVGGDVNFGESQLRELGLNPSDYEETPIVKG